MATVVLDEALAKRLRDDRAASGGDRYDEVWEETYMMAPMPNNEHQEVVNGLAAVLQIVIAWPKLGNVFPGVNVSDRVDDWEQNYRAPDLAVFLNETVAVDHGSFWHGGPDFAVEVVSPGDQTRSKLGFYAHVGTRELLVIDRAPWQLELYKLGSGSLELVLGDATSAISDVLGLTFDLKSTASKKQRPSLEISQSATKKIWTI